jgi:DNA-directed RNA polymerase beta' subunit
MLLFQTIFIKIKGFGLEITDDTSRKSLCHKALDINGFIRENNWKEITDSNAFDREQNATDGGIYSNKIFGFSPKERSEKWGWFHLGTTVFNPLYLNVMQTIITSMTKVSEGKGEYTLVDGMIKTDKDHGSSGVKWLISVYPKIDWEKYRTKLNGNEINFIKSLDINKILIDKWIVTPPIFRDYRVKNGRIEYEELSEIYQHLLRQVKPKKTSSSDIFGGGQNNEVKENKSGISLREKVQQIINQIYDFNMTALKGKTGLIRGKGLSKKVDFTARLVANSSKDIPISAVALPWHVLPNLFLPLVIAKIKNDIKYNKFFNFKNFSIDDYKAYFYSIYKNISVQDSNENSVKVKEVIITMMEEIFTENPEIKVIMKRDPSWAQNSWWALEPWIDVTDTYAGTLNGTLYPPLGGDSMNETFLIKDDTRNTENDRIHFPNGIYTFKTFGDIK